MAASLGVAAIFLSEAFMNMNGFRSRKPRFRKESGLFYCYE